MDEESVDVAVDVDHIQSAIAALEQVSASLLAHAAGVLAQDPDRAVNLLSVRSQVVKLQEALKDSQANG